MDYIEVLKILIDIFGTDIGRYIFEFNTKILYFYNFYVGGSIKKTLYYSISLIINNKHRNFLGIYNYKLHKNIILYYTNEKFSIFPYTFNYPKNIIYNSNNEKEVIKKIKNQINRFVKCSYCIMNCTIE